MGVTNDEDEGALDDAADDEAQIEARMQGWALPIAERVIAEADRRNLAFPQDFVERGSTRARSLAEIIGAMTAMFLGEGPAELLPRSAQETGTGTLRFKRDAKGEVCMTIDERPQITERMSVRDPFIAMLASNILPHKLIVLACAEVEKSILAGEAYLMAFAYDASASTAEEAVYTRSPGPGEIERERAAWARHDATRASLEALRKKRVAKLTADVEAIQPGLLARRLLQLGVGVTVDDLEFGLYLLFAQISSFLNDARQEEDKEAVLLRRDGSVKGAVEIPAKVVADRLNAAIREWAHEGPRGRPITISPAGIFRFAVEVCSLIPDFEPELRCSPDPGGLRVTYANTIVQPE